MIGKHLSEHLVTIEKTLWDWEYIRGEKPNYTPEGFRAGCKIFMSILMDKIWELQEIENISMEDRMLMVEKVGAEVRKLVKIYTDIDTFELYKTTENENQ